MKLVPPTISAIGRAIRLKLMTAPIAITSTNSRDEELHQRGGRQHALGAVGLPDDLLVFGDVAVDDLGALQSLVTLPSTWPSSWTALRQEASMALRRRWRSLVAARYSSGAICALAIDSLIDPAPRRPWVALGVDLGDRLDRLDPAGRGERHRLALVVILLELGRLLGEAAVQRRAFGQVAPDARIDALELALDDALLGLAAGRQQDLAIARGELLLGQTQRVRGETHGVMEGARERDRPMRREPGEIHGHREQDEPQQPGGGRASVQNSDMTGPLRCRGGNSRQDRCGWPSFGSKQYQKR